MIYLKKYIITYVAVNYFAAMDERNCSWSGNADVVLYLDEATIPVVVLSAICYYALLRADHFNLLLAQR